MCATISGLRPSPTSSFVITWAFLLLPISRLVACRLGAGFSAGLVFLTGLGALLAARIRRFVPNLVPGKWLAAAQARAIALLSSWNFVTGF